LFENWGKELSVVGKIGLTGGALFIVFVLVFMQR